MSQSSDADIGLRPLLTRTSLCEQLLAAPSEYDAAPMYLAQEYREHSTDIKKALAADLANQTAETIRPDSLKRQAAIALEIAAPIGLDIVRLHGLAIVLNQALTFANPVIAVLSVPALFLTARRTLKNLKRGLTVDPKVRSLILQAQASADSNDFMRAADLIKDALDQDVNPDYRRNGDLYMQLGMYHMQANRPRLAMLALAKASVLFYEDDTTNMEVHGVSVSVSKRGIAEMMACAAIDSFATDLNGIDEWAEALQDFAISAEKRFEHVASAKETGKLFGLFGVDEKSAEAARELSAKIRFLVAKMNIRSAISEEDEFRIDELISLAVDEIINAEYLDPDERFLALLQQAQFYSSLAADQERSSTNHARRALELMINAADVITESDPEAATRTRAEAASFLMQIIPSLVLKGEDVTALRDQTDQVLENLTVQLESLAKALAYADIGRGWISEQRFHLASSQQKREACIFASYQAYMSANEPVAAMYSALRLAFLREESNDVRAAVKLIEQAAKQISANGSDPVSLAFAARYIRDTGHILGEDLAPETALTAALAFEEAARSVSEGKLLTAFTLHGKTLVHPAPIAELILQGQAAQMYASAGKAGKAVQLFEAVRAHASIRDYGKERELDLEFAELLINLRLMDKARFELDKIERETRGTAEITIQRRALELLNRINNDEEQRIADDVSKVQSSLVTKEKNDGLLNEFVTERAQVVEAVSTLIEIAEEPNIRQHLQSGEVDDGINRLKTRLERVVENRFRLGIVGEFSSGKSTFINALLGDIVLPSSVRPTTSTPNIIRWGSKPEALVTFVDEDEQRIEINELKKYVTERGNPGNEKKVSAVTILHPLDLLERGVELLDTPGVSSLIESHTKITYELIPSCDAILLLATGRQPFSESIGNFLTDLHVAVDGKVFYLLNKIDQLEEVKRGQARAFAEERVLEVVEGALVHSISAYDALAARRLANGSASAEDYDDDPRLGDERDPAVLLKRSGIQQFETSLSSFLMKTRGHPLLQELSLQARDLLHRVEMSISAAVGATRMEASQRLEHHRQLTSEVSQKRARIDKQLGEAAQLLRQAISESAARAKAEMPELVETIIENVNIAADDKDDDYTHLKNRIENSLKQTVRLWTENEALSLTRKMAAIVDDARNTLQIVRRNLRGSFSSVFDLVELPLEGDAVPELEFNLSDNTAARIGINAAIGFLAGFALGPIGIFLSVFIGGTLTDLLFGGKDAQVNAIKDAIRPKITELLVNFGTEVAETFESRFGQISEDWSKQLESLRDEILAEFENQLATLVMDHESSEDNARILQDELATVQSRAAQARLTLDIFSRRVI